MDIINLPESVKYFMGGLGAIVLALNVADFAGFFEDRNLPTYSQAVSQLKEELGVIGLGVQSDYSCVACSTDGFERAIFSTGCRNYREPLELVTKKYSNGVFSSGEVSCGRFTQVE